MAVTKRGRRTAYDNISVGNATGTERTIDGAAPPSDVDQDNIASGSDNGEERVVLSSALMEGENVG